LLLVKSYTPTSCLAPLPGVSQSKRALTFGSLVLSPTGSINLGFTTEAKLATVLIITFSSGFQTSFLASITRQQNSNQLLFML
jgi:hypothetical protein